MKIELKCIKYAAFASQETNCYSAKIYIDDKPFAVVQNDGRGGCDDVYPLDNCSDTRAWRDRLNAIEAELGKTIIKSECIDGFKYPDSLECRCNDLMNDWLVRKEVTRVLKRISYLKGPGTTAIWHLPAKYKPTPKNLKAVKACQWYGDDWIMLNDMTVDEVIALGVIK